LNLKLNILRNFRNLNVWKEGIKLVKEVYSLSTLLPEEEKFGLKSQICRAAVSVPSNIAEDQAGIAKWNTKDFLKSQWAHYSSLKPY
jgi:four helix bundle protein